MDLGLFQATTGQRIGVRCSTVWNWENSWSVPELRHLPKIIAFLGYDPRPEPEDLAERLVWYRQGRGWSQKRFAEVLGIDPATLARWERGERKPTEEYARRVEAALGKM